MKEQTIQLDKGEITYLPINELSKNSSCNDIHLSWLKNNFSYLEKNKHQNGLRPPQIGALFSALGYLKTNSNEAATIVMPTGTGKTETMLSLVVAGHFKKTLVIVPSDALRQQTKSKFVNLGYIRTFKLVPDDMLNPRVMIINGAARTKQDIESLQTANIIITTVASLNLFYKDPLQFLINSCTHLIVDEAHHIEADKWSKIKSYFSDKPVFQFTATPFRSDGKRVDGRVIFEYPIEQAQKDGYFKAIEFYPVREFDESKSDLAIANKAINLLKKRFK
ncbi:DEAD/DEAH box helicase [Morganella morganii]|uniref:DEAD/DEAH box helicase n=1 Tax=Morganella morganii TaxID=582 RepID=UPI0030FE06AD